MVLVKHARKLEAYVDITILSYTPSPPRLGLTHWLSAKCQSFYRCKIFDINLKFYYHHVAYQVCTFAIITVLLEKESANSSHVGANLWQWPHLKIKLWVWIMIFCPSPWSKKFNKNWSSRNDLLKLALAQNPRLSNNRSSCKSEKEDKSNTSTRTHFPFLQRKTSRTL